MKTLFEINDNILEIFENIEAYCTEHETDVLPDYLVEQLQISEDEMSDKLENYFFLIKELKGQVETLKAHISQMSAKRKSIENRIEQLKGFVGQSVNLFGQENKSGNKFYKHDLFKVTATPSTAVQIVDDSLIPAEFKREVVTVKIDKTGIKKALQAGENVDGAVIDSSKLNVTFR